MGTIFICYRRADTADITGRLYDRLKAKYGKRRVFKDVFVIRPGERFEEVIRKKLEDTKAFLVVIGDKWNTELLHSDDDWVRKEIAQALEREIPTIPLLVNGSEMPKPDILPDPLKAFSQFNGMKLRPDPDFDHDVDQLINEVSSLLKRKPVRSGDTDVAKRHRAVYVTASLLGISAVMSVIQYSMTNDEPANVVESRSPDALRLVVQSEHQTVSLDRTFNVDISLQNLNDRPFTPQSPFAVTLSVTSSSTATTSTVTIPAGSPGTTLQLKPSEPGLLAIRASHPQAFEGSAFVRVSAPTRATGRATTAPRLALRYTPHGGGLADGRDAVTIHAFLLDDDPVPGSSERSFKVNLSHSSGTLTPLPLVVQGSEGRSTLTSDRPGDVEVEFLGSEPYAEIEGHERLRIHFSPPIHGVRLEAKPTSLGLLDEAQLIVTLVDASGRPVATDEPRTVALAMKAGRGEIAHKELIIKPGESTARTQFIPRGFGNVEVSAESTSLLFQSVQLTVRAPLALLAVSVINCVIGGFGGFLRRRDMHWTRVATGCLTGFVLYVALMTVLLRVGPYAIVLNPISNFVLSLVCGWLGTMAIGLVRRAHAGGQSR